jgi:hypothetical protein
LSWLADRDLSGYTAQNVIDGKVERMPKVTENDAS